MSKWIDINEYNPPFNKRVVVLVKCKDKILGTNYDITNGYLEDDGYWLLHSLLPPYYVRTYNGTMLKRDETITHWMPLPGVPEDLK